MTFAQAGPNRSGGTARLRRATIRRPPAPARGAVRRQQIAPFEAALERFPSAADVGIDEAAGRWHRGDRRCRPRAEPARLRRRLRIEGNVATDVVRSTQTPRPRGVRVASRTGGSRRRAGRWDSRRPHGRTRHNLCEGVEVNVGTPSNNHHAGQCADSRLTPTRRSRAQGGHTGRPRKMSENDATITPPVGTRERRLRSG